MPDWSYQTIFRPVLFRLQGNAARRLALGSLGMLGWLPGGKRVIEFMGHMQPDTHLMLTQGRQRFATRLGLGPRLDTELQATQALTQFGFGFFVLGPIVGDSSSKESAFYIDAQRESVEISRGATQLDLAAITDFLIAQRTGKTPIVLRLDKSIFNGTWREELLDVLKAGTEQIAAVIVDLEASSEHPQNLDELAQSLDEFGIDIWGCPPAGPFDQSAVERILNEAAKGRLAGLYIEAPSNCGLHDTVIAGRAEFESLSESVTQWRSRIGDEALIVAAGGVHDPDQAVELLSAGADLLQVDTGLIFAGPGLPKRINEACGYYLAKRGQEAAARSSSAPPRRLAKQSWFWELLMGVSMLLGGLLALAIANTRVVMPYDESMAGLTRDEIAGVNARLLDFMNHDRTTLAGTMLSVSTLYAALAWFGARRGIHWAHATIVWSAFAGFVSFFLFLGFGYFDPFHAFVTAVLFQFLLLAMHCDLPPPTFSHAPNLFNSWQWRLAQWGQLLFVVHGAVLVVAGCVISGVGITSVFVETDLEFMQTTADELHAAHGNLVPLVAHDRATFGGMLISCGLAVLLSSLWGFRQGAAWQWWALIIAGNIAYGATIYVHLHVGYMSWEHLAPAYGGLALLWLGAGLTWPYLVRRDGATQRRWDSYLANG